LNHRFIQDFVKIYYKTKDKIVTKKEAERIHEKRKAFEEAEERIKTKLKEFEKN
jgi:hypothetical protein